MRERGPAAAVPGPLPACLPACPGAAPRVSPPAPPPRAPGGSPQKAGISFGEARSRIFMVDSKGAGVGGGGCRGQGSRGTATRDPPPCSPPPPLPRPPTSTGLITRTRGDTLPEHKTRFARDDGTPDMKARWGAALGVPRWACWAVLRALCFRLGAAAMAATLLASSSPHAADPPFPRSACPAPPAQLAAPPPNKHSTCPLNKHSICPLNKHSIRPLYTGPARHHPTREAPRPDRPLGCAALLRPAAGQGSKLARERAGALPELALTPPFHTHPHMQPRAHRGRRRW